MFCRLKGNFVRRFVFVAAVLALAAGTAGCRKPKEPQSPKDVRKKLEKVVKVVMWKVDATADQKKAVGIIIDDLSVDLFAVQQENRALVKRAMDALEAEQIDREALRQVVTDGTALFGRYLKRMVGAVGDMGDAIDITQRRKAVRMWREWEFGKSD